MGSRGPKNHTEMTVVPATRLEELRRLKPPSKLDDEERAMFIRVIESLPADWIGPEAAEGLVNYCRHSVEVDRLTTIMAAMKRNSDFDIDGYRKISQLRHAESGRANELGRALRLFPQSTVNHKKKKGGFKLPEPWAG